MLLPSNFVSLSGHVGKEPEPKLYAEGKTRVTFSLAVKKGKDQTNWFRLVAFGKTAEFIVKYIHRGSAISVLGILDTFSYEKDGAQKTGVNIIAETIGFLPREKSSNENTSTSENYKPMTGHSMNNPTSAPNQAFVNSSPFHDDISF